MYKYIEEEIMSDYATALLKAIESGEQDAMNDAFHTALGAKISDALDAKKVEIAQQIYGGNEVTPEESGVEGDTEASDENGTEEI